MITRQLSALLLNCLSFSKSPSVTPFRTLAGSKRGSKSILGISMQVKTDSNLQPSDNQVVPLSEAVEKFRSGLSDLTPSSAKNYSKAIESFSRFILTLPDDSSLPSSSLPARWALAMWLDGLTPSTISHYIDLLAALSSSLPSPSRPIPAEAFSETKSRLRAIPADEWKRSVTPEAFRKLTLLTPLAGRLQGAEAVYSDIFLLGLISPGVSLQAALLLRADQLDPQTPLLQEIKQRNANPRRRYLFPLRQSELTPAQLRTRLRHHISTLLLKRGIPMQEDPEQTLTAYRTYARLLAGESPEQIAATESLPLPGIPILSLFTPLSPLHSPLSTNPSLSTLEEIFGGDAPQWFAMKLRSHVTFDAIERRLAMLASEVVHPEFYYPADEIATRIGKKLIFKQRPFIRDIIFFRSRIIDIPTLFHHIGDLAWCYTRRRNGISTGYAPISSTAMARFQRTIGQFTPDIEIAPAGELQLRPGDKIRVLGGLFAGLEGELIDIEDSGTIYRVNLLGDTQAIEWRLSDPRLLAPAN